jgi:hypothetical protein
LRQAAVRVNTAWICGIADWLAYPEIAWATMSEEDWLAAPCNAEFILVI